MIGARALFALFLAATPFATAACGGGAGAGGGGAHGLAIGRVVVVIVPEPDRLPFDPRSARLLQATQQLGAIVGAPVTFELDAALLPDYRASFEEELIASIENVARALEALRKDSPEAFAFGAPLLGTIACRYQATAKGPTGVLDAGARTLTITEPPGERALVAGWVVRDAIETEHGGARARRYAAMDARSVPPGERRAYFEYVTRTRPGAGYVLLKRPPPGVDALEPKLRELEAEGAMWLRVTELGEEVGASPDPVAADVRHWLADHAEFLENQYRYHRLEVPRLPPGGYWRRAEAAYARWLTANAAALTDTEKDHLARVLFPARATCADGTECADAPASFPGVDRFAFGLGFVDAWREAGRPRDGDGAHYEMLDGVVCPHTMRADGKLDRRRGCTEGWYQQAFATPATRQRLVQAMTSRHDPAFVAEVFANARSVPADRVVALWRALEASPLEWEAATRVVLEHLLTEGHDGERLADEAYGLWPRAPNRRGVTVYVFAWKLHGTDRHYADPRAAEFSKRFGAPIGPNELHQLLALGPRAMPLVPQLWPALGTGWPRGDVLAPALAAFLDAAHARAPGLGDGEPQKTLHALITRVCETHDTRTLDRVHRVLQDRAQANADDAPNLAALLADTTRCKPAPKHTPRFDE